MAGFLKQLFAPRKTQTATPPGSRDAEKKTSKQARSASEAPAPAPVKPTDTPELQAINGTTAAQRLQGVEQLQDAESLQRVVTALKGRDKGAFQAARQKLKVLRDQAAEAQAQQQSLAQLIADMEAHAARRDTQLYQARLEALEARWLPLSAVADTQQSQRYLQALNDCRQRVQALIDADAAEATRLQQGEEQQETLDLLQLTLKQLAEQVDDTGPSLSALDALFKTQQNRWQEATRDNPASASLQKRFEAFDQELAQYMNAVRRFNSEREALQQALPTEPESEDSAVSPDTVAIATLLDTIDWPRHYAAPVLIQQARQHIGQAEKADTDARAEAKNTSQQDLAQQTQAIDSAIIQLEQTLDEKQLNPAKQHFRQLQKLRDKAPRQLQQRYRDRITALGRQLGELQDWLGFATRPKQEALCQQMAQLAQQTMEPETKAQHIHQLQQAWKELGGSPDQGLWQQFKQAADEAYAPCKEFFAARDELKQANTAHRKVLCDQLQTFVDNADWQSCDWKTVEKIHRQARQEWRDTQPVDLKANRAIQKRFDQLLKQIDGELEQERQRNIARKQAIVQQAEALIDHEPLSEATAAAKALQPQWQAVGITPRQQDRELWQQFRGACDRIFARLSAQHEARDAQQQQHRQEAQTLIAQLEAMDPAKAVAAELRQLQQQFAALDLPAEARSLKTRFQALLDQQRDQHLHALQQQRAKDWQQALALHRQNKPVPLQSFTQPPLTPEQITDAQQPAEQARAYCIRLEILTASDTPEQDRAQRMAMQVSRLNDSLQGQQSPESLWDEIDALLAGFCTLPPEPPLAVEIYDRLNACITQWLKPD